MKTKGSKTEKVNIVTLGCAKNIVDSEVLLAQLKGNNIDVVHDSQQQGITTVIVNTCGFIANAKQESIDTILKFVDAKEKGIIQKLYVTGCLSHRYKDELSKEIPRVDAYFGTADLRALLARFHANYKHELIGERVITTDAHYAYLKISEGCDRPCSFCAIPLMRGKHVSRPMDELVLEAEHLVQNGVKEILLIAQDSTFYGVDLYKKRNLAELMAKLSDIAGLEWIRLHYAFPTGFPEALLDIMAERSNICNYLDIPLQHGSTKILKLMRRGTDRQKTKELLKTIRARVPGIAIRTTLIAGYPGETEEDFQEMLDFVSASRFDRLGVFAYSHEAGTHAGTMHDDVPQEVKNQRVDRLMALQEDISLAINETKIGNTFKTLIDCKEGDFFVGRTEFDSPEVDNAVLIDARDNYLRIGDFVPVQITSVAPFDLYGKVVE